jgi:SAM-dependent methyltransferase
MGGPQGAARTIPRKAEYRVMAPWIATLPKGAKLLDGGCGLGDWTLCLSAQGYPTLGLDLSRKTIDALRQRFPDARFEVGDIRATGLADDSFDGYFSWGTFEHFEAGLEPCVDEARRVLKPGGYLFITVPFDNLRHALRAAFTRARRGAPQAEKTRFYQWRLTRGELRDLLTRGGFEVLDTRPIHKRQGVLRCLHHEFGLDYRRPVSRGLSLALTPFIPGGLIAHMVMAVARKPEARPQR